MSWSPITEPQDWVDFAGQITPGIAEVVGAGSPRNLEERESHGLSGALVVYRGLKLSHFSVVLRLYTDEHWLDWYAFKPWIDKKPVGKRQRPLDITHPITAGLNIRAVIVEDVSQPTQVEDGVWEIEIKLIEYRKFDPALAKADGAKATPADPEDPIIEDRLDERNALANEVIP